MIRNKYIIFTSFIFLVLVATFYYLIKPTINPNDIEIKATLKKIDSESIDKTGLLENTECQYLLTIYLNKKTGKLLTENIKHTIYPYITGNPIVYSQFESPNLKDISDDVSTGIDGTTATKALKKLNELSVIKSSDHNLFSKKHIWGFSYHKENYPIIIRSYIKEENILDNNKNFILYSYYEKKYGKGMSWVKAVKVNKN